MRRSVKDFSGKVAVVTGAGSGIGRATAILLAELGAKVHVVDIDDERAQNVASEIKVAGGRAVWHVVDATDSTAVELLADAVFTEDGRVDVLHNNAGIAAMGAVEETPLQTWRRLVELNLMGVVHGVHAFVPRMLAQGEGHIVNTASAAGLAPVPGMVPYATTKHAVVGLSESLNAELSRRGVYVTALCPGTINTAILDATIYSDALVGARDHLDKRASQLAASPDKVAAAVVDAIVRRQLICTVPNIQVRPIWLLWRISPVLVQPLSRLMKRALFGPS
ncbi:hypothetical protein A7G45_23570 [Mycolicibacterium llatzerense]|nr:hypothetical protein [Mycolicibacterium llatzerense]